MPSRLLLFPPDRAKIRRCGETFLDPMVRKAYDRFRNTGANANLSAWPTDPAFGAFGYGGAAADLIVETASAGLANQVLAARWARNTLDLLDDNLRVELDVTRAASDSATQAAGLWLWAPTNANHNGEGIFVGWRRAAAGTMDLKFERRDAAGAVVQSAVIIAAQAFAAGASKRIVAELAFPTLTPIVEDAGGGNPAAQTPITVAADLRDGVHKRAGVMLEGAGVLAERMFVHKLAVWDLALAARRYTFRITPRPRWYAAGVWSTWMRLGLEVRHNSGIDWTATPIIDGVEDPAQVMTFSAPAPTGWIRSTLEDTFFNWGQKCTIRIVSTTLPGQFYIDGAYLDCIPEPRHAAV